MRPAESIQQHVRCARREKRSMVRKRLDRRYQILVGIRLHDVSANARFDNLSNKLIREMQRENQNFGSWQTLLDATRRLESIEVGHADVHDHDVRAKLFGARDRLA